MFIRYLLSTHVCKALFQALREKPKDKIWPSELIYLWVLEGGSVQPIKTHTHTCMYNVANSMKSKSEREWKVRVTFIRFFFFIFDCGQIT